MQNLLYNVEFITSTHVGIGAKTTIYGPSVDMSDCEGCLFQLHFSSEGGPFETSGNMHLQCSTYSSGGFANYGSTVAIASTAIANGADRVWALDCYKPTFRYMRAAFYHTTGDMALVCMKYNMRKAGSTTYRDSVKHKFATNISSS